MSDRLKDLQRQRALAQEQLAWLDGEIAREAGLTASIRPATPASTPAPAPAVASAQSAAEAEAILARYQSDPSALQKNLKRGCYLYFFAALGLLIFGVLAFYFLRRSA